MPIRQQGSILIIVLTVIVVLSLIVMAAFEQAQWVKRSNYYTWRQVKMRDRLWQQLIVIEEKLPTERLQDACFAPYSLSNDYFFLPRDSTLGCSYSVANEEMQMIYERIAHNLCTDFVRITLYSHILSPSKQQMKLQVIERVPILDKSGLKRFDEIKKCSKNAYRQSWLLQ